MDLNNRYFSLVNIHNNSNEENIVKNEQIYINKRESYNNRYKYKINKPKFHNRFISNLVSKQISGYVTKKQSQEKNNKERISYQTILKYKILQKDQKSLKNKSRNISDSVRLIPRIKKIDFSNQYVYDFNDNKLRDYTNIKIKKPKMLNVKKNYMNRTLVGNEFSFLKRYFNLKNTNIQSNHFFKKSESNENIITKQNEKILFKNKINKLRLKVNPQDTSKNETKIKDKYWYNYILKPYKKYQMNKTSIIDENNTFLNQTNKFSKKLQSKTIKYTKYV